MRKMKREHIISVNLAQEVERVASSIPSSFECRGVPEQDEPVVALHD